jgi:hypothetical protein
MPIYGDNGIVIDVGSMWQAVRTADVIVVGFEFWPERLLIDLRPDPARHTPPLIELVEPLQGVQERNIWLSARRPGVTPPEQFLFFTWPHTVAFLTQSPLAEAVTRRLRRQQGLDVSEQLSDVFAELAALERTETLAAVRGGEGYETAWSSAPA